MLTKKQIRMLELLDKRVQNCKECDLCGNGNKSIPYWTRNSRYIIIGESPNRSEIRQKRPLCGKAGEILIDILAENNYISQDFLIINSVQCSTSSGNIGFKHPLNNQIDACYRNLIRKYIQILNPEKILCLGNYAKYIFDGSTTGVLGLRGQFREFPLYNRQDGLPNKNYNVLFTMNPAFCLFNEEDGFPMLKDDIKSFKETVLMERESDWMFSLEDFLIT